MRHPEHSPRWPSRCRSIAFSASARRSACWFSATRRRKPQIRSAALQGGLTAAGRDRHPDRPRRRICRGRARPAAAPAANPAACAGAPDPAGRYRRGRGAGAGAGRAGRLGRARVAGRPKPLSQPLSRPLSHFGRSCRNPAPAMLRPAPTTLWPPGTRFSGYLDVEMTVTAAPGATGSAAWADALLLSFAQAGYVQAEPGDPAAGRAVSRPLRRGHPQEPLSDHRRQRRGTLPAPRSHHSGGAGLSRLRPRRPAGGLQLSRAGVSLSRRPAERIPAGRHRILRPAGSRRGRRRNAGARRWRRPRRSA